MIRKEKKKQDLFITEISEEDFRKLNLVAYVVEKIDEKEENGRNYFKYEWAEVKMNDVLDEFIDFCLKNGDETDLEDLKTPYTIFIHKENGKNPKDCYTDKYLARLGLTTYLKAPGVKHLYSTRDYFKCYGDNCGEDVRKKSTKSIYRIHIDKKVIDRFVLKHKTEISKVFNDSTDKIKHYVLDYYSRINENSEWKLDFRDEIRKNLENGACFYSSYKEN